MNKNKKKMEKRGGVGGRIVVGSATCIMEEGGEKIYLVWSFSGCDQ